MHKDDESIEYTNSAQKGDAFVAVTIASMTLVLVQGDDLACPTAKIVLSSIGRRRHAVDVEGWICTASSSLEEYHRYPVSFTGQAVDSLDELLR